MPYFTTTSGNRIYYETHGREGPPLILLCGLGSLSPIWEPQLNALGSVYCLYCFDYPGHGRSQFEEKYSISGFVENLRELMDHWGIERAHFLGLSLGASLSLSYAVLYPERVISLVLEAPVGGTRPFWHPKAWPDMLIVILYLLLLKFLWRCIGQHKSIALMQKYGRQTYKHYPLLESMEQETDGKAMLQLIWQLVYPPYIGHLHRIHSPAIIITGTGDFTPKRYYNYLCQHLLAPCDVIRIPGARHAASFEQPEAFNQIVLDFLQTQAEASDL
jgi:pimeloyl-ACP methyl ester carboxylesterase